MLQSQTSVSRGFELWCGGRLEWPQGYQAVVLAARVGSDLMDPRSWVQSVPHPFTPDMLPKWMPTPVVSGGYLEGNVVRSPRGGISLLLRCRVYNAARQTYTMQHACLFDVVGWDDPGGGAGGDFNDLGAHGRPRPALSWQGFVSMPGGGNKFVVR